MKGILANPLFIIALVVMVGQVLGNIEYKHIKLGGSATLFVGLFLSYSLKAFMSIDLVIDKTLFLMSLIGFIATVGLAASGNIINTLKKYGLKFMILSFFVTATGGLMTYIMISRLNTPYQVIGSYVGALTSSPGLASALELAGTNSPNVGLGYAIAYVPGVLVVILFAQIMGRAQNTVSKSHKPIEENEYGFNIGAFMLVILLGILLGSFKLKITDSASLSLGMTGGVLVSALILGSIKSIGKVSFQFNHKQLQIIRNISLNLFLSIVGLNYGYSAMVAVKTSGLALLFVGLLTGITSILVGMIVGKYLLKIETVYLVGGICGGMTSTPGLAAAIEKFNEEEVVTGYGATYPFALIFMILFTNLLFIGY
ncbi:YidE/YbjL duplication [Acidaminobacter sp. JC074]|uniref:aspartate-alanine antiporter-like transporter n=1 Tax=Acidaminobacter sp. JC074 TaxID=2530199 RepID=UPI001F1028EB|nr:YidE/YbjL duplication [Acidaminobacter sp. JC074]MCH4891004.1 YidE/YbjL duplication [Acidaminobacter sp. JC074]